MILTALKTGLTAIRANASGILLGVAFLGGATAATIATRIFYLSVISDKDVTIAKMHASKAKEDAARAEVVRDLLLTQAADREAEIARIKQSERELEDANNKIDRVRADADKRVRLASIKRICDNPVPEGGKATTTDSSASDLFDYYDRSLAEAHSEVIAAVAACERDRESVIMQAGGR